MIKDLKIRKVTKYRTYILYKKLHSSVKARDYKRSDASVTLQQAASRRRTSRRNWPLQASFRRVSLSYIICCIKKLIIIIPQATMVSSSTFKRRATKPCK